MPPGAAERIEKNIITFHVEEYSASQQHQEEYFRFAERTIASNVNSNLLQSHSVRYLVGMA